LSEYGLKRVHHIKWEHECFNECHDHPKYLGSGDQSGHGNGESGLFDSIQCLGWNRSLHVLRDLK
jgi:hypothetical protein